MENQAVPHPDLRNGKRRGVNQFVDVRTLDPDPYGRTQSVMKHATVVDVSTTGASLRVAVDSEIVVRDVFELGVAGAWGTVQVVWARPDGDDLLICGVEFVQPEATFLSALEHCLGRSAHILQTMPSRRQNGV